MTFWFSSDFHFGHANIIKYCDRPFKDVNQMNETIIRNHNQRVKPNDTFFFLGDFCFINSKGGKDGEGESTKADEYLDRLNGRPILVKGNHDNNNSVKTCLASAVIDLGREEIYLCHDPADYNPEYSINLVGHVHEHWKIKEVEGCILVNVGVDVWGFKPINIQEIMKAVNEYRKAYKG